MRHENGSISAEQSSSFFLLLFHISHCRIASIHCYNALCLCLQARVYYFITHILEGSNEQLKQ